MFFIGDYDLDAPEWIKALLSKKAPDRSYRAFSLFRLYDAGEDHASLRDKTSTLKAAVAGIAAGTGAPFDVETVWEADVTPKEIADAGFEPVGAQWAQRFRLVAA